MPLFDYILFDGVDVDGDVDRDKLTRNVNVDFFNTMVKLASVGSGKTILLFKYGPFVKTLDQILNVFISFRTHFALESGRWMVEKNS